MWKGGKKQCGNSKVMMMMMMMTVMMMVMMMVMTVMVMMMILSPSISPLFFLSLPLSPSLQSSGV